MLKINENIYNKIGELGVYIYTLSLFISKAGASIGLGLLFIAFLLYFWDKRKINLTTEEKYILAILILLPIFSLFSAGGTHSFQRVLEKSYRYIVLFFIPYFLLKDRVIKIGLFLFSLSILINFIQGIRYMEKYKWQPWVRYLSFSSNTLDEAHILAMGSMLILVAIVYYIKERKYIFTSLFIFTLILAVAALVMTQGRGAWLGFGAGLFVVSFFLFKSKKIFIAITILTLFLGYGAINSKALENNRYIKRFESIQNKDNSRILLWKSGIEMYKANPIFGVGRDNAGDYSLEYMKNHFKGQKPNYFSKRMMELAGAGNLHSLYITSLAEEGILSIPFIGMFLFILYRQIKYCLSRERDFNFYIVVGTAGMLVAFLVGGLTENVWREIWKSNMFVFIVGVYLSRIKNPIESDED